MCMMNWLNKVNAIQTTDNSNIVKKADYDTKIEETDKKIINHDHDKYITTLEFVMLTTENFEAKLATKGDIDDFMKKEDFDEKVKKKKATPSKRKLKGRKKLNDLLGEVKLISTKGLAKKLINGMDIAF